MAGSNQTIVIVGGGFAGVYAARYLEKQLPRDRQIVLFSKENHFIFTPLLGDVVGSSINPQHVVFPIRQMVRRTECRTATLQRIDLEKRLVEYATPIGQPATQAFDHLVLACGAVTNLNIIPGMAAHGWPLKTMGDALLLRNHVIGLLEKAEVEPHPLERQRLLSVIVVGGGFSGVEVAGEIHDLMQASRRFYKNIRPGDIQVTILEGRDRILPELPERLSAFATKKMTRNGIVIRTGAIAQAVTETSILLKDGTNLPAGAVVCTIGTTANPVIKGLGLPMVGNRLQANADLRVPGQERVWALGDCAVVPNAAESGKPAGPTAQMAVRQARTLADNLTRSLTGKPTKPFSFKPLGMLAAIGNYKAVGLVFGLKISGFIAWFMWRGIYLFKMPTLARKIQIAFDWAWQLIFPRDLVQFDLKVTERFASAHFEPGQYVFHKGEPGDKFYLIERGQAQVFLDEGGPPVATLNPGDHFGEGALLRSAPRSASVRAATALDLFVVSKQSFHQLAAQLEHFRQGLERSDQGNQSAAALLEVAKNNPLLESTPVSAVMAQPVATLALNQTLGEALRTAQDQGKGAYPVVDALGGMVGLCTRTDFYNAMNKLLPYDTPLTQVMKKPVISVSAGTPLTQALLHFVRAPIKRLVVTADDDPKRPVGIVTPFDIVKVLGPGMEFSQAKGERVGVEA